jgi:hypothetical protein
VLPDGVAPHNALKWDTRSQRRSRLRAWRRAICCTFSGSSTCIRIAWTIADLITPDGYAYPGNGYLAAETGIDLTGVERALTTLNGQNRSA